MEQRATRNISIGVSRCFCFLAITPSHTFSSQILYDTVIIIFYERNNHTTISIIPLQSIDHQQSKMFNKPSKTSSTSTPSSNQPTKHPKSCFPTSASMSSGFMTPRHAELESSYPAAYFGKKSSPPASTPATITTQQEKMSEAERRISVDSTATTATSSSVSSAASTIAAEKEIAKKWMAEETQRQTQQSKGKQPQQQQPFDVFDYQAAGYLSMPMDHEAQPYRNSTSASSSRKSSSSSSSSKSQSLWQKTKNLARRDSRSSEEKEQAKKEYEELGLEKKTKFGVGEGAGMRIVG